MTILTLNVWGGQRRATLVPFIEQLGATVDLFCLQEMTSATVPVVHREKDLMTLDLAEQFAAILPDHQLLLAPSREQWGEQLALFVRGSLPLIARSHRQLVTQPTPGVKSSSGAFLQGVTVATSRGPLRIGHLHGYWEPDEGEDKPPRAEQVDNLLRWIDESPTAVVLCGDFNMNRASRGIDRLSERLTNLIRAYDIPTTRPSWNRYHGTVADYCFVSPAVTVRRFEVLPNEDVSDHLALLVEVAV